MKKPIADKSALFDRDPKFFETDKAAVAAIIQAAVEVELFTIPLYMTSLYSLQGYHQINSKGSNMYQGRKWPGLAPSFTPGLLKNLPANEKAFNTIFSVFIEEMLHLQIASNLANIVGVLPKFTRLSPETANYAWSCYGDTKTEIPYILDFEDCKPPFDKIKVKLDKLCLDQNELFLAIEAPEGEEPGKTSAIERIKDKESERKYAYFPSVPLKDWKKGDKLPMFGSIGHMYQCLWDYFDIEYKSEDGKTTTLWEKMYSPGALQRDLFNVSSKGHPYREYQGLETVIDGWLPPQAKEVAFKLICAITDQGEGKGISKNLRPVKGLTAVKPVNQASDQALKKDYPSYSDTGKEIPSAKAHARFGNGGQDHYERFLEIKKDLEAKAIVTWDMWREERKDTGKWEPDDFKCDGYEKNPYFDKLPTAEVIADAMNRLAVPKKSGSGEIDTDKQEANYNQFCQIATGAIAGITTVLDAYWEKSAVGFPFPSMGGSGDRLMMCWAVFGKLPDLSRGVQPRKKGMLYHACQGMNLNTDIKTPDVNCGSPEVYHNCRGSNSCKAEGGCGFVQEVGQSKTCSSSLRAVQAGCGLPAPPYSAPADNMCKSFGGCAVPISASQIFPEFENTTGGKNVGAMELNDFEGSGHMTRKIPGQVVFSTGDFVYDIAWEAFKKVLASRDSEAEEPVKPQPSDIRLAFPPST
ncbi:MAG: uncharacterized protein JWO44_638 [Bacteroidetes bacterium]|nr:uncharacterized protein [Bacteroidota bacterium]